MKKLLSFTIIAALLTVFSLHILYAKEPDALDRTWQYLVREYYKTQQVNKIYAKEFNKLRAEGVKFQRIPGSTPWGDELLYKLGISQKEFNKLLPNDRHQFPPQMQR